MMLRSQQILRARVMRRNSDSAGTLKIKPDQHDFGKVIVSLMSAPADDEPSPTNRSQLRLSLRQSLLRRPFSIQSDGCSGSPLTAGASCEVAVLFHPTTTGKVKDKKALTFTDSARKSPQHVELEGQGIVGATPTATATATATTNRHLQSLRSPNRDGDDRRRTVSATTTSSPTPSPTGVTPTPTVSATTTPTASPLHATRLSDSGYRASRFDRGRSSLRWQPTEQRGSLQPGQ